MRKPVSTPVNAAIPNAQRRRLLLSLPGSAVLSAPWLLAACGGGGGDNATDDDAPRAPAAVTIAVPTTSIRKGATLSLTAAVTNAPAGELRYRWRVASSFASLYAPTGEVGATIETTSASATLATTPSTPTPVSVTVEVLSPDASGVWAVVASASTSVTLDDAALVAAISPREATLARVNGTQAFTMTLSPVPSTPQTIRYEWSCPSDLGSLSSGGQTTAPATPTILSTSSTATYTARSGLLGGEAETIRCTAYYTEADPLTGQAFRTDVGTATADVLIEQEFNIVLTPASGGVPTDVTVALSAGFKEALPEGTTVEWTWLHSGAGVLTRRPALAPSEPFSTADLSTGSSEGSALLTVGARVSVPGRNGPLLVLPVSRTMNVTRNLRTFSGSWTIDVEYSSDGASANVVAYVVVPKVAGARSYRVLLEKPTPDVRGGVPFPSTRDFSPGNPGSWSDRGGVWWSGLSSLSGNADTAPAIAAANFQSRFSDMKVTITVTL